MKPKQLRIETIWHHAAEPATSASPDFTVTPVYFVKKIKLVKSKVMAQD